MIEDYSWPGPWQPMSHQITTTRFAIENDRGFILNGMGTGKTASALWAADYLMELGEVRKALVVAPLSTLERVWRDESFKLLTHRRSQLLYGSADKRRKLYDESWDIGIINFDGVNVLKDRIEADDELDLIIIDEATAYRNSQTERWKLMRRLSKEIPRLWLMTGTPCPQDPTDAFGLAKLLGNPDTPRFFGSWKRETMRQISEFKWIPRPDGYAKAFKLLQPAVQFKKEDCTDLPPMTFQSWEVELTKAQKTAYRDMQKKMKVEWANHGEALPAVNAADKINKLRQIACGVVKDTQTGEYIGLPCRHRIDAVLEGVSMAAAKVIVVVPFKGAIHHVAKELRKHYTCEVINGDVTPKRRNEIITRFCNTPDPHILAVHPKVMAHGLTLVEADTMIFYAPIYSNEETQQIIQRINRPGQTRSMTVIQLGATALEWSIYEAVERRAEGEHFLLSLYKSATTEKA